MDSNGRAGADTEDKSHRARAAGTYVCVCVCVVSMCKSDHHQFRFPYNVLPDKKGSMQECMPVDLLVCTCEVDMN